MKGLKISMTLTQQTLKPENKYNFLVEYTESVHPSFIFEVLYGINIKIFIKTVLVTLKPF